MLNVSARGAAAVLKQDESCGKTIAEIWEDRWLLVLCITAHFTPSVNSRLLDCVRFITPWFIINTGVITFVNVLDSNTELIHLNQFTNCIPQSQRNITLINLSQQQNCFCRSLTRFLGIQSVSQITWNNTSYNNNSYLLETVLTFHPYCWIISDHIHETQKSQDKGSSVMLFWFGISNRSLSELTFSGKRPFFIFTCFIRKRERSQKAICSAEVSLGIIHHFIKPPFKKR